MKSKQFDGVFGCSPRGFDRAIERVLGVEQAVMSEEEGNSNTHESRVSTQAVHHEEGGSPSLKHRSDLNQQ